MRCEPANSLIQKFGGLSAVAKVVEATPNAVMRWRMPKAKGGTGGAIPHWHIPKLIAEARRSGINVEPGDFIVLDEAAA
ncbi:hypothetical protein SAMN06297251_102100 [Fulvimarina manganoxydans]|uniref:DNA-binding transcriptional regulator Cro n=1 Tax=Fulvimarina manganoxydans TaxID=937218 RepID=A0A1W1YYQ5_9HYPH|nr:hypothetical protein SAMN06297251_102100 [Fulvimarina manganoxydans]